MSDQVTSYAFAAVTLDEKEGKYGVLMYEVTSLDKAQAIARVLSENINVNTKLAAALIEGKLPPLPKQEELPFEAEHGAVNTTESASNT